MAPRTSAASETTVVGILKDWALKSSLHYKHVEGKVYQNMLNESRVVILIGSAT